MLPTTVGVGHLGNLKQFAAAVPVHQHEHGALGIVGSLAVVKLAVEGVAVSSIGNHGATILSSPLGEKKVGAGRGIITYG